MGNSRYRRGRWTNARVYQQLRTAHLERAHTQTPATILYVERNYDFAIELTGGLDLIQAGVLGVIAVVLRSRFAVVEVNEPLMRQRLVRTIAAVGAATVAARMHGTRVSIVTHAIENRDPFGGGRPDSIRSRVRLRLDDRLSRRLASRVDRISFGTEAAQRLYEATRGKELRTASQRLFPELPAPCDCSEPATPPSGVVFLGAFDERKGVRELLAAWPLVTEKEPSLELTLMGKGPLTEEVVRSAAGLSNVSVILDPPRDDIHVHLRAAQVLVLLSQPRARWREQVGLPIVEALAHGCTIVTTDQTGLASWLREHGHYVVPSNASRQEVANAVLAAIRADRTTSDVTSALPAIDGRSAADNWLFGTPRDREASTSETHDLR